MSKATRNIGIVLLVLAVVYFYLAPAFRISDGTEVVLWANIIPGIVLALLGIVLVVMGLRGKKEDT
jgi:putative Mn2+ efflux pump MntP